MPILRALTALLAVVPGICVSFPRVGQLLTEAVPGRGSVTDTGDYFWPSGRGPVRSYGASAFPVTRNLSAPTWSWHHPNGLWSTIPVGTAIDDRENIFLTAADGLRKFSVDGKLLWTYTLRDNPHETINNAASLMDGAVYGVTSAARAFAVSMETGRELWSKTICMSIDGNDGHVAAYGGVMITACDASPHIVGRADTCCGPSNHVVVGLNGTDGSVLWRYTPEISVWNFMASFAGDGTFIFQDIEGRAHRNSVADGTLIWKSGGYPGTWTDGQAAMGSNGIVYSVANFQNGGFTPGALTAFRLEDGQQLWSQTVPKPPNNQPAVGHLFGQIGLSVVQPIGQQCEQGQQVDVYAFDAKTGELQWTFMGPTQQGPFVAGDFEGQFQRVANGVRAMTLPNPWGPPSIDGDGTVFLGSETGHFFALRDVDGDGHVQSTNSSEMSVFETGAAFVGASGPALAPGMLAVGSINTLYVWRSPTSHLQ